MSIHLTHSHNSYAEAWGPNGYGLPVTIAIDSTPPIPDPMTWATVPYEISTSAIQMVATTASDLHGPVEYSFYVEERTGGGGSTHSGWVTGTTYTDSGLGVNHQYRYWVSARDTATSPNYTAWSILRDEYTAIELSTDIMFGTKTSTSIGALSTNTPSGLTRGSSGLVVYNTTAGTSSGWKQNNNFWTSTALSPNTQYCFTAQSRNGDATATALSPSSCIYTLANQLVLGSFSNITQTSIQVNLGSDWNPAGTEYWISNATTVQSQSWSTSKSWVNTGLTCGTTYTYGAWSRNGDAVIEPEVVLGNATTLPCSPDTDNDGVPDSQDNCTNAANGPLILDAGGNSQIDTDGDGYGNLCDADLNQTWFVDFPDLTLFSNVFFTADADADLDGAGFVDFADLTLFSGAFFQAPGPSCVDLPGGCVP